MFEDRCLVCGIPLQDAWYASAVLHRGFNAKLSIIVGLTAVTIVKPTTFRLLQYLPLAAHVLPQT